MVSSLLSSLSLSLIDVGIAGRVWCVSGDHSYSYLFHEFSVMPVARLDDVDKFGSRVLVNQLVEMIRAGVA
jgi:hypothetical protein